MEAKSVELYRKIPRVLKDDLPDAAGRLPAGATAAGGGGGEGKRNCLGVGIGIAAIGGLDPRDCATKVVLLLPTCRPAIVAVVATVPRKMAPRELLELFWRRPEEPAAGQGRC